MIAALGVTAVSAAIVFDTVLDLVEGDPLAVATGLAYPVTDLILLGVVVGALASTGWWLDRAWILLAVGVTTFWLADSLFLVQTTQGVYESGGWYDAGWWAGLTMIAAAAWQPPAARMSDPVDERVRTIAVPLSFGALGLCVLVYGAVADVNLLAVALAAASILAVMARATLTFGQNVAMLRNSRDEALTDALTGLGNRRALSRALTQLLPKATLERPLVLALFDLDGFKQYNDTFGHPAGDALLVRLSAALRAHVDGRGRAFRMGGDEFCAIFETGEPLIDGAVAALSEHGDSFSVTCTHGSITLPLEAADAVEALRIADQRMYAGKQADRTSAGRQSADVLLRALTERDPGLGTHAETVALAVATAEALGLGPDDVENVRQASELHDVGKVAIPDAILGKPGPLTEEEWVFVRRHPVIGERIILAAPALARVGALVRSSHERWDGTGYPDALAAEAIPLGARIVAVADAYAAMTAGRPYRAARTPEQALDELQPRRRHAVRPRRGRGVVRRARAAHHPRSRLVVASLVLAALEAATAAGPADALDDHPHRVVRRVDVRVVAEPGVPGAAAVVDLAPGDRMVGAHQVAPAPDVRMRRKSYELSSSVCSTCTVSRGFALKL